MKPYICLLLCFLLVACETPYAKQNAFLNSNYGYDDMHVEPNIYLVTFRATTQDQPQNIVKKLYYRAAEITQENGATYFKIIDTATNNQAENVTLPGWSNINASGTVAVNPNTGTGNYSSNAQGYYMPPVSVTKRAIIMQTMIEVVPDPAKSKYKMDELEDADFILQNWKI
tara:strand:- start:1736 stop:2248 length:513 start_codon:yes stop_codon:yes gene_type:complete